MPSTEPLDVQLEIPDAEREHCCRPDERGIEPKSVTNGRPARLSVQSIQAERKALTISGREVCAEIERVSLPRATMECRGNVANDRERDAAFAESP